jgi:hypothetical protein
VASQVVHTVGQKSCFGENLTHMPYKYPLDSGCSIKKEGWEGLTEKKAAILKKG